ncbi:uncharacterized protein METZ01_LOCUS232135, partial [marine metagenome]
VKDKALIIPPSHMFDHWLKNHQKLGGFLASSYVDWNLLHSPCKDIVKKLEEYKRIPFECIMEFADAKVTDNSMEYRDVMEDISKIFYLCELIQHNELTYNPQILHEPWHNRYRVHPGSGRLMALWLCGYESIKTIYIHFDEPGFQPPGDCFIIKDRNTAHQEFHINPQMHGISTRHKLQVETYAAFPKLEAECIRTRDYDYEWDWSHIHTNKFWQFMRFSEGGEFLDYKNMWRSYAIDAWQDLQHDHIQIGSTEFNFDKHRDVKDVKGRVIEITRHTGSGDHIDHIIV